MSKSDVLAYTAWVWMCPFCGELNVRQYKPEYHGQVDDCVRCSRDVTVAPTSESGERTIPQHTQPAIRTLLEQYRSAELEPSDNIQDLEWFVEWCERQASA